MWVHRRSEEPSCTEVQCYWQKSRLSRVGTTLKFISAKDLSKGSPVLPSNYTVLGKFLKEGKKRNLSNCELLKYQHDYNINLTVDLINKIEAETRDQFKNKLWYELRFLLCMGHEQTPCWESLLMYFCTEILHTTYKL
nr:unnamed protein product [Callosobruchus chinensis]